MHFCYQLVMADLCGLHQLAFKLSFNSKETLILPNYSYLPFSYLFVLVSVVLTP